MSSLFKFHQKWFTLVELIVVVTILAILGTIGFIYYNGYLLGVRDSNRTTQLQELANGLELYRIKNTLPLPDKSVSIKANGTVIAYQGYLWQDQLDLIDYSKGWKDPKDQEYFTYYLSADRKKYQLLWFLEDVTNQVAGVFDTAYAADYSIRYPVTTWKKLWVLMDTSTNIPIQVVGSIVSAWFLDIVTTTNTYTAQFSDKSSVSWTGSQIITWYSTILKKYHELDSALIDFFDMETTVMTWGIDLIKDFSSYHSDALRVNSLTFSWWKTGQSILFNDLNSYLWVADNTRYKYTWNWLTISFWTKINLSETTGWFIISKPWNGGGQYNYYLYLSPSLWLIFQLYWSSSSYALSSNGNLPINTWVYLTVTVDSLKSMKMYINWILNSSTTHNITSWVPTSWDYNLPLSLGTLYPYDYPTWGWVWLSTFSFGGNIDEFRMYNRALSDTEISNLYKY